MDTYYQPARALVWYPRRCTSLCRQRSDTAGMVIDRYKIKKDTDSGIINDPNGWFENPRDLITAIERIVHVSVESTKVIEGLPSEVVGD